MENGSVNNTCLKHFIVAQRHADDRSPILMDFQTKYLEDELSLSPLSSLANIVCLSSAFVRW